MPIHLHLDPLGGISGDMFIGALLDARPDLADELGQVMEAAGFPDLVKLEFAPHNDGTLSGSRFCVSPVTPPDAHAHRHYREIRESLTASALPEGTKAIALDIFRRIAEVEAAIHGKQVETVAFHEVGAWDSIADITLAAHLISRIDAASWSVSPLPLGRGRVTTAHGELPVPAPATSRLLAGLDVLDDGIEGERVTPTGAAILNHLAPDSRVPAGKLTALGYGFGSKRFPGLSNVLRVCFFDKTSEAAGTAAEDAPWQDQQLAQLEFEIDDQTAESLAHSLAQLRAQPGVLDVREAMQSGKKNRLCHSVTLLVTLEAERDLLAFCFDHTATLGIRRERVNRAILPRREYQVEHEGKQYRVKVAKRPGGLSAKVDLDDLNQTPLTQAQQSSLRALIEAKGLALASEDIS